MTRTQPFEARIVLGSCACVSVNLSLGAELFNRFALLRAVHHHWISHWTIVLSFLCNTSRQITLVLLHFRHHRKIPYGLKFRERIVRLRTLNKCLLDSFLIVKTLAQCISIGYSFELITMKWLVLEVICVTINCIK